MFLHSYRAIGECGRIEGVVVVVPEGHQEDADAWVRLEDSSARTIARVGGETRQASVYRGLQALPEDADLVVCHDAARPFASVALFERVIERLGDPTVDGVIPVVPTPDTVKRIREGLVVETLPRQELGMVQTPQAFRRRALEDAHERAARNGISATDDAMLLEAAGYKVAVVDGEPGNFKVTTPEDVRRAEHLLAREMRG
jgi:2-C-methyl-D-erythritol 4-phosphate cytidylyltransferase